MAAFKSTKYVSILGHPVLKSKMYASLASVLIVVCGAIGGLYYLILHNSRAAVPEPEVATAVNAVVKVKKSATQVDKRPARVLPVGYTSLSPLAQLLEKHIKATRLDEVSNFIVSGTYSADSGRQKRVLKARAPDLYKYASDYPAAGAVVEFGYDGERAWVLDSQSIMGNAMAQRDFFVSIATMEASFAHLAWSYRSLAAQEYGLDSVLELLPDEEWHGRTCAVVRSHGLLPITMYHYIDTSTYREVYRRAKFANPEGVMVEVGIGFSPPDGSQPYGLPMGYQLFVDGTLNDTVKYTDARFNQVILSGIFAAPRDSIATNLAIRQ